MSFPLSLLVAGLLDLLFVEGLLVLDLVEGLAVVADDLVDKVFGTEALLVLGEGLSVCLLEELLEGVFNDSRILHLLLFKVESFLLLFLRFKNGVVNGWDGELRS